MAGNTPVVDERNISIGSVIRAAREAAGMSQDELASKIGYNHRSQVHRLEAGGIHLKAVHLLEIAKILNLDLNHLRDLI